MNHLSLQRPLRLSHSRGWWYGLVLVFLAYLIISEHNAVNHSFSVLATAHWQWVLLAVAAAFGSHCTAALKYQLLGLRPLSYFPTFIVQLAGLLTSRLLPAGVGGVGVNYLYLRRSRHTKSQAAAVVSMNSLLGFVGHMLLVMVVVILSKKSWHQISPHLQWRSLYTVFVALATAALLIIVGHYWHIIRKAFLGFVHNFVAYKRQPVKLVGATACSIAIALFYVVALSCAAKALGLMLPLLPALIVLTVGILTGTLSPTPGGLIGAEAGLAAALLAYHLSAPDALAITILYRLVTFWISLAVGLGAFISAERTRLI